MEENYSGKTSIFSRFYNAAKESTYSSIIVFVLVVLAVTIYGAFNGNGSVMAQCDDKVLGVAATDADTQFVFFENIKSVELCKDYDYGTAVESLSDAKNVYIGTYENSELGQYTIMCFVKPTNCIIVEHTDGILVFNCKTDDMTVDQFKDLSKHVDPSIIR